MTSHKRINQPCGQLPPQFRSANELSSKSSKKSSYQSTCNPERPPPFISLVAAFVLQQQSASLCTGVSNGNSRPEAILLQQPLVLSVSRLFNLTSGNKMHLSEYYVYTYKRHQGSATLHSPMNNWWFTRPFDGQQEKADYGAGTTL